MNPQSVSIMIPAYNEEKNIETAVQNVTTAATRSVSDYEIIIVNDGSHDKTGEIVERLAEKNKKIRVIHHEKNTGLGTCFQDAITHASKIYFCGYPGDGDISSESLSKLLSETGSSDVIIQYLVNQEDRPPPRRIISILYTKLLNSMFGLNLKYFNGYSLAKVSALRRLPLLSSGHTIYAEIVIRLVKAGFPYKEIPFRHVRKKTAKTKVLTLANVYRLLRNLIRLFIDIQIRNHYIR